MGKRRLDISRCGVVLTKGEYFRFTAENLSISASVNSRTFLKCITRARVRTKCKAPARSAHRFRSGVRPARDGKEHSEKTARGCPQTAKERRFSLVKQQIPNLTGIVLGFLAASKQNFANKYPFESSRRYLHNALLCTAFGIHNRKFVCTALQSQFLVKICRQIC